ncbi:MAG TPA: hypothetical protein ENH10_10350, partial [Bacteroidetes bacterium]|nr:hypothetical protein [Bacteroidota bacterium]HEX05532.1 hypothetical protein [Bacteroidota bacterium]
MSLANSDTISTPNPVLRRIFAIVLSLLLLAALIYVVPLVSDIITIMIISLVISYALYPLMIYLERRGINRVVTILIIFIA